MPVDPLRLNEAQKQSCRDAELLIKANRELERSEAFQRLVSKCQREADALAQQILDDDTLTGEQREALRRQRKGIMAVLKTPAEEVKSAKQVLVSHGINPNDI